MEGNCSWPRASRVRGINYCNSLLTHYTTSLLGVCFYHVDVLAYALLQQFTFRKTTWQQQSLEVYRSHLLEKWLSLGGASMLVWFAYIWNLKQNKTTWNNLISHSLYLINIEQPNFLIRMIYMTFYILGSAPFTLSPKKEVILSQSL